MYETGSIFKINGTLYILARFGNHRLNLISLEDGNRRSGGIDTEESSSITDGELNRLTHNAHCECVSASLRTFLETYNDKNKEHSKTD